MKFNIKNNVYSIRFKYYHLDDNDKIVNAILATECFCRNVSNKDEEYYGFVRKYHKDKDNKHIARRLAFTKMLKTMNLTKEERKEAWLQFLMIMKTP